MLYVEQFIKLQISEISYQFKEDKAPQRSFGRNIKFFPNPLSASLKVP